jgi:anti-anti-sigma regulatory factor
MEFKIDTKPNYTLITPISNELNVNLTDALTQKWQELTQSGSKNLIVDLHNCIMADKTVIPHLLAMHEEWYLNEQSLVFTNLQDSVMAMIKDTEADLSINIAPTMVEAIDIVSMEILERDLFNEES